MRQISASYIISNLGTPLKNGILILNDDNSVEELVDRKGSVKEIQNLEYYSGILVPGFIDVFTFLSWPQMNTSIVNPNNLNEIAFGEQGCIQTIQKGINHLEAFGTKGAADFYPDTTSHALKKKSKLCFRDIHVLSDSSECKLQLEFLDSTLGRLFPNNISLNNAFCIGTGSLASHTKLSVFDELKYLQNINPDLRLEHLIKWSSFNGAETLGFDHLGSFMKGKRPGVNLITSVDYDSFTLRPDSKLKVLV